MPFIIGIAGKRQAGKSTFGRLLKESIETFPPTEKPFVVIEAMATPVRNISAYLFGDEISKTKTYHVGSRSIEGRDILEAVGTGLRLAVGEDIWCHKMWDRLSGMDDRTIVIIDDIRFLNEVDLCDYVVFIRERQSDELGTKPSEHELLQVCQKADVKVVRKGSSYNIDPDDLTEHILDLWSDYTNAKRSCTSQTTHYGD